MNTLDEMNKKIEMLEAEIEALSNCPEVKKLEEDPKLKKEMENIEASFPAYDAEFGPLDTAKMLLKVAIIILKIYPQAKGGFKIMDAIGKKQSEIAEIKRQMQGITNPAVVLKEKTKLKVSDELEIDLKMFEKYPQLKPYKKLCIELDAFDDSLDENTEILEGLKSIVKFSVKFITNYPRIKRLDALMKEIEAEELSKAA